MTSKSAVGEIILTWVFGAALILFGVLFIGHIEREMGERTWFLTIWVGFIVVCVPLFSVLTFFDARSGPQLTYDRVRDLLILPRVEKSWPRTEIIGWQVVHHSKAENERSQLILVVKDRSGSPERYLLFAGCGRSVILRIRDLVDELDEKIGIKLISCVYDGAEQPLA